MPFLKIHIEPVTKVRKNNPSYVKLKLTREGKKKWQEEKEISKKQLVSEYGVKRIADIQNTLKDLLGGII